MIIKKIKIAYHTTMARAASQQARKLSVLGVKQPSLRKHASHMWDVRSEHMRKAGLVTEIV